MNLQERRALDIELAIKVLGFVYVNGTEAENGKKYSVLYSRERAADWLRLFPDAKIESQPWADVIFDSPQFTLNLEEANRVKEALWKTEKYHEIATRIYLAYETKLPCVMVTIHRKDWDRQSGSYCCIESYEDPSSESLALCVAISRAINDR